MEKLHNFWGRYWKFILIAIGVGLLSYILLFRQLGSLPAAYSQTEVMSRANATSLHTILHNPVDAPYELLVWLGLKLGHESLYVTRVAAAIIAIGIAILFYWVALHWYSRRVSLLATIAFVTSGGFLHFGRLGSGMILQMAPLVLISTVILFRRVLRERLVAYLLASLLVISLYIPGMFWFELIGLVLLWKHIRPLLQKLGTLHSVLISILSLLLIAPLVWASVKDTTVLLQLLALPNSIPHIQDIWQNLHKLGGAIFYRGYYSPEYWLYGAPLFNIIEIVLLLAGLYTIVQKPRLRGNYYVLGGMAMSTILILIGGGASIAMLMPLFYLVIAAGIYYLLDQWLVVFPRNPLARGFGVAIMCVVIGFSAYYHLHAYYVAWPKAPETEQVYNIAG